MNKQEAEKIMREMGNFKLFETIDPSVMLEKLAQILNSLIIEPAPPGDECACGGKGYVEYESGVIDPNGIKEIVAEPCDGADND